MKTHVLYYYIALVMVVLSVFSCAKPQKADIIPEIEFLSQEILSNELSFKIHFIDGDGDIGLNDGDTLPPFNEEYLPGDPLYLSMIYDNANNVWIEDSANFNGYNVTMKYFAMQNGEWIEPNIKPHMVFRLKDISPSGQDTYLAGSLTFGLGLPLLPQEFSNDTVKFSIQLKDRALHYSNEVETPIIYL